MGQFSMEISGCAGSALKSTELAKAARDGTEDDVRIAGNALGQAITNALMEVFEGLLQEPAEVDT
ncbi:MAG: hypothetical protein LCH99_28640 [Proteobacteria bacterium]|nr:hypothetical protein [Pseudomonadota bacterium]